MLNGVIKWRIKIWFWKELKIIIELNFYKEFYYYGIVIEFY